MVTGWIFNEFRDRYIEGEAHAIWESPWGKRTDITPHDFQPTRVLFSAQESVNIKRLYTYPKPKLLLSEDYRLKAIEGFEDVLDKLHSDAFSGFGGEIVTQDDEIITLARSVGLPEDVAFHLVGLRAAAAQRAAFLHPND